MSTDETASSSLEERLNQYSDSSRSAVRKSKKFLKGAGYFAGTAAALAMGTTEAEAGLLFVDVGRVFEPDPGEDDRHPVNITLGKDGPDVGVLGDFEFFVKNGVGPTGLDYFKMGGNNGNKIVGSSYSANFRYAAKLDLGFIISSAVGFIGEDNARSYLAFADSASYPDSGQWLNGGEGYIGFAVVDGVDTYYGWFEVRVDADNVGGEIIRYAIDDTPVSSGSKVTISAVPEPNALACFAIGAAGILGWRRRRRNHS